MHTINDVHIQFAEYFKAPELKPYLYYLSKKMSEGHVCIDIRNLNTDLLPIGMQEVANKATDSIQHPLVSQGSAAYKPFVIDNHKLYLQRYFAYETKLYKTLLSHIQLSSEILEQRKSTLRELKPHIAQLFGTNGHNTDWQLVAALLALLQNFCIITGGPGTGKTTTVAKILALLLKQNENLKIALAAPTGKASVRMAESIGATDILVEDTIKTKLKQLQPTTLHRLLGWKRNSPYFAHNKNNPLPYDVLLVDECSMIDLAMFSKLMQAVSKNTKVILLGDKDQLSSVEAGSAFSDLCSALPLPNLFSSDMTQFLNAFFPQSSQQVIPASEALTNHLTNHVVTLQYSHRFSSDSGIGKLSHAVITGNQQILNEIIETQNEETIIDTEYDQNLFNEFLKGYETYIKIDTPYEALLAFNKIKVLCATRNGEMGVKQTNIFIQNYIKKIFNNTTDISATFYENMPIMITENNYNLGLFNGDIGIIRKDQHGDLKAWFINEDKAAEEKVKSVLPAYINNYELAFAMTIHKSQGSEFEEVLIRLPRKSESNLLTKELLYTGITRAKQKVIIQAEITTLFNCINTAVERGSGLTERLSGN